MNRIRQQARRFLQDESGTLMAEGVIVLPFMLWAYLALFVYWDAYRAVNISQKAAYTISDMVSREMTPINSKYVVGLRNLLRYLVGDNQSVKLRLTSVTWVAANKRFEVHWSQSPDNAMMPLTTTTLQSLQTDIPKMSDGDYVILLETEVMFHPAFNVGLSDAVLKQFIITRPRFVPKVCLTGTPCT